MKIATILPTKFLWMERTSGYHMALAHLVKADKDYAVFFRYQAERQGTFVLMDNGVVETGQAMPIEELVPLAGLIRATEMILPDVIYDIWKTIELGLSAMRYVHSQRTIRWAFGEPAPTLMAVPQGNSQLQWRECVLEMIHWPVESIGISRFVSRYFDHRAKALSVVPELLASNKNIHILGCPGDPIELCDIDKEYPGRIRGVDSGVAAIYTQVGAWMAPGTPKPDIELDFNKSYDREGFIMLDTNVNYWKRRCRGKQEVISCPP